MEYFWRKADLDNIHKENNPKKALTLNTKLMVNA